MGFVKVLQTVFKTAAKTKKTPAWQYNELDHQQMLYSSDYLKQLVLNARDKESLYKVIAYIHRHHTGDIGSYKDVVGLAWRMVKKIAKESLL